MKYSFEYLKLNGDEGHVNVSYSSGRKILGGDVKSALADFLKEKMSAEIKITKLKMMGSIDPLVCHLKFSFEIIKTKLEEKAYEMRLRNKRNKRTDRIKALEDRCRES